MSFRDDRDYRVVYSDRARGGPELVDDYAPRRRPREHDQDLESSRGYERPYRRQQRDDDRDFRPPEPRPYAGTLTKTQYEVGRDRNADAYVKRTSNAMVIVPNDPRAEFEVLRPERRSDGVYVIDANAPRGYDDRDRRYDQRPRYHDEGAPSRYSRDQVVTYDVARGNRPGRAIRHADYRDVQVMEDVEPARDRHLEIVAAEPSATPSRMRSAMRGRNDSPPEAWTRRRGHSVGFFQDQVDRHDASEGRHERPGAEAHVTGRHLHQYRDEEDEEDYYERRRGPDRERSRSRSRRPRGPRGSDPRLAEEDYEDERHEYTERTMRQYDHEEPRPLYPPADERKRRHHHSSRRQDDDRSSYSDYEAVTRKTKEYYR